MSEEVPGGRVWVEDRAWRLLSECEVKKCRQPQCPNHAVASFLRYSPGRKKSFRWAYCADHLYGRKIIEPGVIVVSVDRESEAAERGYAQ